MHEGKPVLIIQIGGNGASTVRLYIYLLNVPSFSSRYFSEIKRKSCLGRLLALSLEILLAYRKKGGPGSDCWSSLIWDHTVSYRDVLKELVHHIADNNYWWLASEYIP